MFGLLPIIRALHHLGLRELRLITFISTTASDHHAVAYLWQAFHLQIIMLSPTCSKHYLQIIILSLTSIKHYTFRSSCCWLLVGSIISSDHYIIAYLWHALCFQIIMLSLTCGKHYTFTSSDSSIQIILPRAIRIPLPIQISPPK